MNKTILAVLSLIIVFLISCGDALRENSLSIENAEGQPDISMNFGPMDTISTFSIPSAANLEMIWCPPGTFMMGSPESEKGRRESHHVAEYRKLLKEAGQKSFESQHRVSLKGFYLSKYEVTRKQWSSVLGNSNQDDVEKYKPMDDISWNDVKGKFLPKLNEIESNAGRLPEGWKYDLPTEAQWEYACRAGTTTPYWWGNDGNYTGRQFTSDANTTADVGSFLPNPWGFHDMQGNVWEMTADYFAPYPKGHSIDPTGPAKPLILPMGPIVAGRGAAWTSGSESGRSAYRGYSPAWGYAPNWGFRLALTQFNEKPSGK